MALWRLLYGENVFVLDLSNVKKVGGEEERVGLFMQLKYHFQ